MDQLLALPGRPIDEPQTQAALARYQLVDATPDDEEDPDVWFKSYEYGILIKCEGDDEHIRAIFLYIQPDEGYSPFAGPLPDGITRASTQRRVRKALGAPTRKSEHYGLWDRWDRSGHAIHVQYDPRTKVIQRITLMTPDR